MKTFLLIYLFTLGSGDILEAEDAMVRTTPAMCEHIAVEREEALLKDIQYSNGLMVDVTVKCREVAHASN